jgi:hypothetical protein
LAPPSLWTPDSRRIAFASARADKLTPNLHWLRFPEMGDAERLTESKIAYSSSGREEVYVRPFPGPGGKWQVSSGGGNLPTWSRTKGELFYGLNAQIMVAAFTVKGLVPSRGAAALVGGAIPGARISPHVRLAP